MSKLECDVIRDLLPSYVDGICSEASKRHIEEHIAECKECERLMRQLRDTEIVTDKLEQREFDGLKKAKRQISQQGISGTLLAVALILSAIAGWWLIGHGGWLRSVVTYYFVLLGCCILCTIYFTSVRKPMTSMGRIDWSMAIISILTTTYLTWLVFCSLSEFEAGRFPFGELIAAGQYGMFVRVQLNAVAILQMALYVLLLWRSVKKQVNNGWVLSLCLMGGCISHLYETYMGRMDLTFETLGDFIPSWMAMAAIALGIGLAGIVLSLILSKVRANHQQS